jgi:hypothetical protein
MQMEQFLDHTPLTEEEALGLLKAGNYPCYIDKVEIKTAKNGNKHFVATILVHDIEKNDTKTMITWFFMPYILKHAYDAANLSEKYQQNKLSNKDLEGKELIAKVRIKKGNDDYPQPRNEIYDFVVNNSSSKIEIKEEVQFNDDLPF